MAKISEAAKAEAIAQIKKILKPAIAVSQHPEVDEQQSSDWLKLGQLLVVHD